MIEIRQHEILTDRGDFDDLRREFRERHAVLVRQLVDPGLLARLLPLVGEAPVNEREPGKAQGRIVARELCIDPRSLVAQAFTLLFNNSSLFRSIEELTGCPPIGNFQGRIYMMRPGAGHYDTWHTDNDGNRLIGLSCNLSADYAGGVFQIRDRQRSE